MSTSESAAATPERRFALGIVPHASDWGHAALEALQRRFGDEAVVIDVREDPLRVLARVAECEAIASSALHGLVAADALGIPNAWIVLGDRVEGQGFKFPDYFSAFGSEGGRRKSIQIRGDERLYRLLRRMVKPGAAVEDVAGRLDEVFRGLTVAALLARTSRECRTNDLRDRSSG